MHTVIRSYSGSGATALFDTLEERKEEVESLIRAVTGFVSYSLVPHCRRRCHGNSMSGQGGYGRKVSNLRGSGFRRTQRI